MDTSNNFVVQATFRDGEDYWILDIFLPMYFNEKDAIKPKPLEFVNTFDSKDDAYKFAKNYLSQIGISSEILESYITYK